MTFQKAKRMKLPMGSDRPGKNHFGPCPEVKDQSPPTPAMPVRSQYQNAGGTLPERLKDVC